MTRRKIGGGKGRRRVRRRLVTPELIEELVTAAMKIAMFDYQNDDENIPEVKYHRDLFREEFGRILRGGKGR